MTRTCSHGFPVLLMDGLVPCPRCSEPGRSAMRKRNHRQSRKWLPSSPGLKKTEHPDFQLGNAPTLPESQNAGKDCLNYESNYTDCR